MRKLIFPILVLSAMLLITSVFIVNESERGIVIRFGRVLKDNNDATLIYQPGLHFKVPFFDSVKKLDARIQTMDGRADRFVTSEKKDVIIDSYVKWKIQDFSRYYLATGGGSIQTAETLLERKVNDILRSEIGSREIKQVISSTSRDLSQSVQSIEDRLIVEGGRDKIRSEVLQDTRQSAIKDLGVDIVDFQMKKINLPEEISESIYLRMRAERESVARRYRSQGREKADIIRAQAELEVAKILAEADKTARITRGDADAEAARIYSAAYEKAPEFFSFLRSLRAYENSFSSKQDVLVIDPQNSFFKYMNDPLGKMKGNKK